MNFIGIDLAWNISDTPKRKTGLAAINKSGYLIGLEIAASDSEIMSFVGKYKGDSCAVGIDAPLVVPNETGHRPAEKELARLRIGAHAGNRVRLYETHGGIRGEVLVEKLESIGFNLAIDYSEDNMNSYSIFEVFPRLVYRLILGLDSTVKMKRKKGVRVAGLRKGLGIARDEILSGAFDPPLVIDDSALGPLGKPIINQDVEELKGLSLDQFGDMLDAIVSAYMVYFYYFRRESARIVGTLEEGYILMPLMLT